MRPPDLEEMVREAEIRQSSPLQTVCGIVQDKHPSVIRAQDLYAMCMCYTEDSDTGFSLWHLIVWTIGTREPALVGLDMWSSTVVLEAIDAASRENE